MEITDFYESEGKITLNKIMSIFKAKKSVSVTLNSKEIINLYYTKGQRLGYPNCDLLVLECLSLIPKNKRFPDSEDFYNRDEIYILSPLDEIKACKDFIRFFNNKVKGVQSKFKPLTKEEIDQIVLYQNAPI